MYEALTAAEVKRAIEFKTPPRVPALIHFWFYPETYGDRAEEYRALAARYPYDLSLFCPILPGYETSPLPDHPEYVWIKDTGVLEGAYDARICLPDWGMLDRVISQMPDPYLSEVMAPAREKAGIPDNRYRLGHFWYFYFERLWSFRGMENALMDLHLKKNEVHRLFKALTKVYIGFVRRLKEECNCDGILVTDDVGTQQGLFFSPAIFKEMFAPYYKEVIDECKRLSMHFWLHSCGNITEIVPNLIDLGVDVLHPIQKYAMNEIDIASRFAGKLCIWGGMDVQQILPKGTPEDVRREVRFMIDTYARPEGGFMMTAGNGLTNDIPLENLEAFFDETFLYGGRK